GQSGRLTDLDLPAVGCADKWTVRAHGLTDPGRVRPANEDQFLIATLAKALQVQETSLPQARVQFGDERGHLFVVADGMGGHQGGEQASALALGALEQFTLNTLKWFFQLQGPEGQNVVAELQTVLQQTDARVYQEAAANPHLWGMGTTVTLAYNLERDLFVVH